MFGIFKKKKPELENKFEAVKVYIEKMGYELLPSGVEVALLGLISDYSPIETASHIAYTTLALDMRETKWHASKMMLLMPQGQLLLAVLKECKDKKIMTTAQWQKHSMAVWSILNIAEHHQVSIDEILSDPITGKERLAESQITPTFPII